MWADGKEEPVEPGTCIYLPRQVNHSLKNLEATPIRLLGVFHPSGSPAVRYGDE
jgi:mannose-6-phosphate isomerase-like protein (cupin superfamily)